MCGIFGFAGNGNVRKIMGEGLQSLEYRGYDSCGYAFLCEGKLTSNKKTGKGNISNMVKPLPSYASKKVFAISHTRWATHGKVNEENAHPHFDCKKNIAVVHNGIIENHSSLKKTLLNKGHRFISETDTEVIAHLLEDKLLSMPYQEAFAETLRELEGSFSLLVLRKNGEEIVGARKGSPLIVGRKGNMFFLSSDINSIVRHTEKALFLKDGEMFTVNDAITSRDIATGEKTERQFSRITVESRDISLNGFNSYMEKEISEQPEVIKKTFECLCEELPFHEKFFDFQPKRLIIVSCGSSWHAGLIGEYMIENALRIPVEVEYASEFRYRNPVLLPGDMVVSISQSGETADTMGAVQIVKGKTPTLAICNALNSSIARECDHTLYTRAGPEIGVASTKAFTAQIAAIYFLAVLLGFGKNPLSESFMKEQAILLKQLAEYSKRIFDETATIEGISEKLKDRTNALFLGRGAHFPVALEGALKMKEVSYIHAEGYPAAEMKHGPIALIDENMPVVFISVKDRFAPKVLSNMEEIKSRGGYIITVTDNVSSEIKKLSDDIITVPEINEDYLKPVLTVIPLQMMACFTALKRGCDVDKPRNLAKSVTVE